jgi:hypothetical protein
MRYDIFISYSRQDGDRVRPLADELRRRGYRVFYDVQSVVVGEQWKANLERSVRASRVLVLCWSESARRSEFVSFEFSLARGLRKPVLPWLLDQTPLPAMIEIQGIVSADATQVASTLQRKLGWTLARRRCLLAVAGVLLVAVLSFTIWLLLRPPPPWALHGEVYDRRTHMPIEDVEVIVELGQRTYTVKTDSEGKYLLYLPQPQPAHVNLLFRKNGYEAEIPIAVSTNKPFDTDMQKLP